jgi:serpin B
MEPCGFQIYVKCLLGLFLAILLWAFCASACSCDAGMVDCSYPSAHVVFRSAPFSTADSDRAEAVRGNNAFAVELYRRLSEAKGNLFFSPESVSISLAMTYAGARGETARQMAETLHFTLPQARLQPAMAALLRTLNAVGKGNYQLSLANALWVQKDYALLPTFSKLVKNSYGAALNPADFCHHSEDARSNINLWAKRQTANKIIDLIGPGILDATTRLVLANAIYFKGIWDTQFDTESTTEQDFHVAPTHNIRAKLMQRSGSFPYFNGGTFGAVEIPYKNKDLSMIIFLPNAVDGLSAFERSMSVAKMQDWLSQLQGRHVTTVALALPRYQMTAQFNLNDSLTKMGMQYAFDSQADFSGMTGSQNLLISAVLQKAYIDVNEQGTEAVAATGTVMGVIAGIVPFQFRADHSFVFLIQDSRSGSILFMGRVADPSQ